MFKSYPGTYNAEPSLDPGASAYPSWDCLSPAASSRTRTVWCGAPCRTLAVALTAAKPAPATASMQAGCINISTVTVNTYNVQHNTVQYIARGHVCTCFRSPSPLPCRHFSSACPYFTARNVWNSQRPACSNARMRRSQTRGRENSDSETRRRGDLCLCARRLDSETCPHAGSDAETVCTRHDSYPRSTDHEHSCCRAGPRRVSTVCLGHTQHAFAVRGDDAMTPTRRCRRTAIDALLSTHYCRRTTINALL